MSDRVLIDGEIERYDTSRDPILIRIRILPILALAFCVGAALGHVI